MLASGHLVAAVTAVVATCGIIGTVRTFISTIRDKPWGHRLSHYVRALCLWDMGLLLSVFALKMLICLWIRQKPVYLWSSMESLLVLSLGSVGDLCVMGSTWVMVVITTERYMAVSQPFQERTRNKNSVKWICAAIVIFSIAINLPRSLLEYHMSDGVNVRIGGVEVGHEAIRLYAIFGRIIPDLLFRSPTPIVISIFLTFKIVKYRSERLNCREHSDLYPNSSIDSGVHSTPSRMESNRQIKSPLLLAVLNGKFLVCNIVYIGVSTMQWLDYRPSSDSAMVALQMLREFSNVLLIIHSATNWLFFRKWQSSIERQQSVPNYEIFDAQEKIRLTSIWAKIDVSELGTELLLTLLENNTSLIKSICPHVNDMAFDYNELRKQPRIVMVGSRIGQFIEWMMKTLNKANMTKDDFMKIRTELRSIGLIHFVQQVKMTSRDWHLTKRFLVDLMLEKSDKDDSRKDEEVANKFASFVIHEMKNGYMCESARTVHHSTYQLDRDQQASSRSSLTSGLLVCNQCDLKRLSSSSIIFSSKELTTPSATLSSTGKAASMVAIADNFIEVIDADTVVDDIVFV